MQGIACRVGGSIGQRAWGCGHDFRPIRALHDVCHSSIWMAYLRVLGIAGLIVWLMVGLPVLVQGADSARLLASWAVAYVIFGVLFMIDMRYPRLSLLALQAACVIVIVALLCDGFEGTLMVLIATRLGSRVSRFVGLTWILLQALLLAAAISFRWNPHVAFLLVPPYFGFQILAFFTFQVLERESRIAERLRMTRELHDSLGHHLTALTLNLESALVRADGEAKADVQKAQTLARGLLADIRAIVAGDAVEEEIDLTKLLESLALNVPQPRVHLQVVTSMAFRALT